MVGSEDGYLIVSKQQNYPYLGRRKTLWKWMVTFNSVLDRLTETLHFRIVCSY